MNAALLSVLQSLSIALDVGTQVYARYEALVMAVMVLTLIFSPSDHITDDGCLDPEALVTTLVRLFR